MDLFSRAELRELISQRNQYSVSIQMPAHMAAADREDPIRFKNLVQEAQERLVAGGMRSSEARSMLKPASDLVRDSDFWRNQGRGLAVYVSQDMFRAYRLPMELAQLVAVDDRFLIKPLLPMISEDGMFYILAVSQKSVRLLQCTHWSSRELELDVPHHIEELLQYEQYEQHPQWHTQTAAVGVGGGKWPAQYHGQAVRDKKMQKNELLRYFQTISRGGLHDCLRDETVPLVFAGVDYLFPIFREANVYAHLMETPITGNVDRESVEVLQQMGWEIVGPHFARNRDQAANQYDRAATRGLASDDVTSIVPSASRGRVGVLFVTPDSPQWGHYDSSSHSVDAHQVRRNGDTDLADLAACETLRNGGIVYSSSSGYSPSDRPIAAIYRY